MGLGNHASRIALAGTVLLGSLSARPAFSQTLTVTLGGPVDTSSSAGPPLPLLDISPITFGSTGDYVARISNGATGTAATSVTLTVPPPAIVNTSLGIGALSVSGGADCTTDDATGVMTCTIASIPVGGVVDEAFSVSVPVPEDPSTKAIPTDPTFCPSDTTTQATTPILGPVTPTVTVSTGTVTQATPAPTAVSPYADLVATLDGPANASQGQTVTYTATITNNGPCPSINVFVDTTVGSGLLFQSGTGVCTSDDQCSLGDMTPGQSVSFTKTYKVDELRNNLTSTNDPNNITVHSGDSSDPTAVIPGTDDPDSSNDSPATTTFVQTGAGGGCSSAGSAAPWAVAVLGLLALSLRRRRAA